MEVLDMPVPKECLDGRVRLCRGPRSCVDGNTELGWSGSPYRGCLCPSYSRGEWDILCELRAIRELLLEARR